MGKRILPMVALIACLAFASTQSMARIQSEHPQSQHATEPEPQAENEPGQLIRIQHATRSLIKQLEAMQAEIWTRAPAVGRSIEAALSPDRVRELLDAGWSVEVLAERLHQLVRPAAVGPEPKTADVPTPEAWYAQYRTLEAYRQRWAMLETLREAQHPNLVRSAEIGHSLEGRTIPAYHVTGTPSAHPKPVIVVLGGVHAREWIAHTSTTYAFEQFVRGYGVNDRVTKLLDTVEFVFVPMLNVDGFVHDTMPGDPLQTRFWRKNMRRDEAGDLHGVDLNRNFSVAWGQGVPTQRPDRSTYPGTGPFSEPETAALEAYLLPLADRVVAQADIHASGGVLFAPYSHTGDLPEHRRASLSHASAAVVAAMNASGDLERTVTWRAPGKYGGTTKDWSFDAFDAVTWTFELASNFVMPTESITPWGRAVHAGLVELGEFTSRPLQIAVEHPGISSQFPDPFDGWSDLGEPQFWRIDVRDGTCQLDPASIRVWQRFEGESGFEPARFEPVGTAKHRGFRATLGPIDCYRRLEGLVVQAATVDGQMIRFPESGVFDVSATVDNHCPCRADLNLDGTLTILDYAAYQDLFNQRQRAADFDADGSFTIHDFLAFQSAFDAGCD
ncbi:MAG: hypothetical protein NCW75_01695 [Phycisphaera sp.]|nr:MAG: hypothetical protein NCW75_01695 [Phycisphaera sp.]